MKVAVLGAGAMGLRYGLLLQSAGTDVDFVEPWDKNYNKVKEQGGVFVARNGSDRHLVHVNMFKPEEYNESPDLVILFVKQMDNEKTLEASKHFLNQNTYVLTNQNGMGAVDVISKYVPRQHIIAGTAFAASILNGPGDVNVMGERGSGQVHLVNVTEQPDDFTNQVVDEFDKAGMNPSLSENYKGTLWQKLLLNSVVNTLCTLMDITMGEYQTFSEADELTSELVNEAYEVADADGVKMLKSADEMTKVIADENRRLKDHRPSMYQDMSHNRPTEVDYINGYIVKKATEHGLTAPHHEMLVKLVHLSEQMKA
ncbi:ketopantoate reductase family protein (plasmid) [Nicoliella spurrieriana]|uniref:2-dehydropantoate 2-reductase n=1 Tax=Nicoliella spurrieriana TaxID=2925830 RepID=A0A976X4L4_9LACO|nr:ketopantoate reductase family protein [Nicoliella spurrieriana]UQS86038.1 ketopantoate reductase family protein [Nicoliella spurrieriana]